MTNQLKSMAFSFDWNRVIYIYTKNYFYFMNTIINNYEGIINL